MGLYPNDETLPLKRPTQPEGFLNPPLLMLTTFDLFTFLVKIPSGDPPEVVRIANLVNTDRNLLSNEPLPNTVDTPLCCSIVYN